MIAIFYIIAPLFFIIFFVAFLRHIGFIKGNWTSNLNQYVLKIGLPTLIFTSLAHTNISLMSELRLIFINFTFLITVFFFSYAIAHMMHLDKKMRNTIIVCLMFSNVAYMGIPILTRVFDDSILPQISIIVAIYLLVFFGMGVSYLEFTRHRSTSNIFKTIAKTIFTNPILIAVFLGTIIQITHIPLPSFISISLDMIATSVTPIVLVIIGIFIGPSTLGKLRDWKPVALFTLGTLIIVPLIFYIGLILLRENPSDHIISILESAMPLGITPFAIADHYNLNKGFIARTIVLSTALSIVTLPFWISFLI